MQESMEKLETTKMTKETLAEKRDIFKGTYGELKELAESQGFVEGEKVQNAQRKLNKILDWISKEVSIQPTDRGIKHLKSQIISYIIPQSKEEQNKIFLEEFGKELT